MVNRAILLVLGCLVVAGLAATTGCGKSGGGGAAAIDKQAITGTWLEVRDAPQRFSPRMAAPKWESPNIRQITINADRTFKLIVCKPNGTPLDASGAVEGTWKAEGAGVVFAVTGNTLKGQYEDWAPVDLIQLVDEDGMTRCHITHENYERGTYERQP
jgi:hypothetical protein